MFESSAATPAMRFTQAMGDLHRVLDVLADIDATEIDSSVLGEALLGLLGGSRRLSAVHARVADRFASSGVWVNTGARSAHAWVSSQTNESQGRAIGAQATGAGMRAHPVMAAAFTAGVVTSHHVDILTQTAQKFPTARAELERNATSLVDIARMTVPRQFAQELAAICHLIDPAAMEADEGKRDSEAHLHLSRIGSGMWRMDGLLPDEVGTHFKAVLDAVRRRIRAEAKEAQQDSADERAPEDASPADSTPDVIGIDVFGNPIHADETPAQAMDFRYTSRQNIDALRFLLTLVAPAKNPDGTIALPSLNGARPLVHLTVEIESLLEESHTKAAAWLERFGVPASVISAAKAALLACDATIEPMIMRDGQLVATLPSLQSVPAHLRKAVLLRDEQCRINSCTSAVDEVHHLIYLSHGGPTTMANLAGLCWFHHHLIHHGNWTLTGDANDLLTLTNTTTGQSWINRPPRKHSGAIPR